VAAHNLTILVDQNWRIESKGVDAFGDSPDLRASMLAGIARVRSQLGDRHVQNLFVAHCVHPDSLR
jgi:hypothetical protein